MEALVPESNSVFKSLDVLLPLGLLKSIKKYGFLVPWTSKALFVSFAMAFQISTNTIIRRVNTFIVFNFLVLTF